MSETLCPICQTTSRVWKVVRDFPVSECDRCTHRFVSADIPSNHVDRIYSDDYFHNGGAGYINYLDQSDLLAERGESYAKILRRSLGKSGRVLDVGAAAGFLLEGWMRQGWSGIGIEPNASMVQHGQNRGLDIRQGVLADMDAIEVGTFHCIAMIQVMAHIPEPLLSMKQAWQLLEPGGIVLIETWNRSSWVALAMGSGWHEYSPPSVLHWFDRKSLNRIAELAGFELVRQRQVVRWLNVGHAKSLLKHSASSSLFAAAASKLVALFPSKMNVIYPGDDLFYAMYRKPK
jgi:2-polyprenyl-3-methyl-5-hydroxy-6-metoxy-1,4-benzoquinol methylase